MCPEQETTTVECLVVVSRQEWEMVFTDDFLQENTKIRFCIVLLIYNFSN